MSDATDVLNEVIEKLLFEQRFNTRDAAEIASVAIAAMDGVDADDIPNVWPFFMDGLQVRAKGYQPQLTNGIAAMKSAAERGQTDFYEHAPGFYHIIRTPWAQDENHGTIRLPPVQMTLPQLRAHIHLARKKAEEGWRRALVLQSFVRQHPEWEQCPEKTLGDILKSSHDKDVA